MTHPDQKRGEIEALQNALEHVQPFIDRSHYTRTPSDVMMDAAKLEIVQEAARSHLSALQAGDIEALYKKPIGYKYEGRPSRECDYDQGWNDCIDHLHNTGRLRSAVLWRGWCK